MTCESCSVTVESARTKTESPHRLEIESQTSAAPDSVSCYGKRNRAHKDKQWWRLRRLKRNRNIPNPTFLLLTTFFATVKSEKKERKSSVTDWCWPLPDQQFTAAFVFWHVVHNIYIHKNPFTSTLVCWFSRLLLCGKLNRQLIAAQTTGKSAEAGLAHR